MMVSSRAVSIRFYVGAKRLRRGEPWLGGVLPVDRIVEGIEALKPGQDGNEEWIYNGRVMIARVRRVADDYAHVAFYRIRQDNLPSMRRGATGDIEDLDIDDEDALAEPTEMLFFRNGVIVHAVNRDGPGSIQSAMYIEEKTGVDLVMASMLRADTLSQLREDDEVQAVAIKVVSGNWQQLQSGGESLRDAARSAISAPGTGSIELVYRAQRGQKERFWATWLPRIRRILAAAEPSTIEKLSARRIDPDARRPEMIDLLESKITVTREIEIQQRSRHLIPEAAAAAMIEAYNAEQNEILAAVQDLRGLTFEDDTVEEAR